MISKTALDYAKMGCDTLIKKWSVETLPPALRFHYHQGVFLSGMQRTLWLSGEQKYYEYIKTWVDLFVNENGEITICTTDDQFDDMQPAILIFDLYKKTGDERYKKILDHFIPIVEKWPKNAKGGFWHKLFRQNQMWLDTLYMIGPFCAMYAKEFDKPYLFEVIYQQMNFMRTYMTDKKTGLLYHGWDDSRAAEWSNPETGLSPHFWGRAIGWYAVAILDILEYLPEEHPRRADFIQAEIDIIHAIVHYQDEKTGLWCQVVDRTSDPDNWFETSCSCLYTYALSKGIKMDILDDTYEKYMHRGYQGVIDTLTFDDEGNLFVNKVCVGTGIGDYQFYLQRPVVQNDLHGMGAFLLMCTEYYDANNQKTN